MAKVTFILGLCGSGKSHMAMEMLKLHPAILYDEGFNNPMYFQNNYINLIKHLKNGSDAIIIEMEYRSAHNQKVIEQMVKRDVPGVKVVWEFFENNVTKANKNIMKREERKDVEGHLDINERISPEYEIPLDAETIEISID